MTMTIVGNDGGKVLRREGPRGGSAPLVKKNAEHAAGAGYSGSERPRRRRGRSADGVEGARVKLWRAG